MSLAGILTLVIGVSIFLVTVTLHEYCHGLVADRLGDRTARDAGRLTLNPLKHIDPFWTVLLPVLLFVSTRGQFAVGMARPVPVNFLNLRNPRWGMMTVAAAGPLANLVLAVLFAFCFKLYPTLIFLYAVYFNLGLAIFNLIPIPPLDGSRILTGLLPPSLGVYYLRLEPFGFLIVLALYFSGLLYGVLIPSIQFFCKILAIPGIQF